MYVFACLGGRGNSGDKPQTSASLQLVHAAAQEEESAREEVDIYTILGSTCSCCRAGGGEQTGLSPEGNQGSRAHSRKRGDRRRCTRSHIHANLL